MGSNPEASHESTEFNRLLESLPAQHLEPLWLKMNAMVPPTPKPIAVPYMWKFQQTLPYLAQAGKLVPAEQAERRVLMLVNPALGKQALSTCPGCTNTY
jgi:gentisate 1,2-dioxygenase